MLHLLPFGAAHLVLQALLQIKSTYDHSAGDVKPYPGAEIKENFQI